MTSASDYIQLEVLKNSLESIADSMALTVVRTSRSSVVKTGMDFSTAVLSPRGELVGQGLCSPIHLLSPIYSYNITYFYCKISYSFLFY